MEGIERFVHRSQERKVEENRQVYWMELERSELRRNSEGIRLGRIGSLADDSHPHFPVKGH